MSKVQRGQKCPTDTTGNAVHVAKIVTGEIAGAKARQDSPTRSQRSETARKAATARWGGG